MDRIQKNVVCHAPWLLSDRRFLELRWEMVKGRPIDLDNPKTFDEKLQWLKLYDHNPLYHFLADKYEAKIYASRIIGEEHIIPTLGVYRKVSDIVWEDLPEKFILKCTHDSGGLVVCRDRKSFDRKTAEKVLAKSLRHNYYFNSREWCYKDIRPAVICERLMEDETQKKMLVDYKFFCFSGKPEFLYISVGLDDHSTASISFFDLEGKRLPFRREDFKEIEQGFILPNNFNDMKEIASKLAEDLHNPFVRIDLYSIGGQVYFSEYTFYPNGGYLPFSPDDWDWRIGQLLSLPESK